MKVKQIINDTVQRAVDDYIELYVQYKDLEKKLKGLRNVIEPYMQDNNIEEICGLTINGCIKIETQDRPIVSAKYTTYDVDKVINILNDELKAKCIVNVVDKDKLEALHKLGEISEEILAFKILNTISKFSAKYE